MSLEMFFDDDVITVQQPKMKICTKCKTPKPATPEYFNRNKNHKYGLHLHCKECIFKAHKVWYQDGGREKHHKNRHKSAHLYAFSGLRNRVKREGKVKFLLGEAGTPETEAYIKYLQTITHCPDCSKELVWLSEVVNNPKSASFDRIDSDGDYTKENVRNVCSQCNRQKNNLPVDEWVALLEKRVEKGIIEEVDSRLIEFLCEEEVCYVK